MNQTICVYVMLIVSLITLVITVENNIHAEENRKNIDRAFDENFRLEKDIRNLEDKFYAEERARLEEKVKALKEKNVEKENGKNEI